MEKLNGSNIPDKPVTEVDLSLISVPELLEEINKRCSTFVFGYDLPDEKAYYTCRHYGSYQDRIFLSRMLDHLIIKSGDEDIG